MTSLKADLQAQIAVLQSRLAVVNRIPDDTFNFGTVTVFASGAQGKIKWYYAKVAEETWKSLQDGTEKSISQWVSDAVAANIGYFEVYELRAQPLPWFASS